jgi:microcystin-dependent protein
MSSPFVAEIRIFACNFAPTGWAFCNGQFLPISQNTALFSLLGTTYGGNGQSTFALPDLQGSVPLHVGADQPGPGLSVYDLGQQSGSDFITLLQSEMPVHSHTLMANNTLGDAPSPPGRALARYANAYQTETNQNLVQMAFQGLPPAGGSLPHNNLQPYLVLNFCIALQGVFPPRQ